MESAGGFSSNGGGSGTGSGGLVVASGAAGLQDTPSRGSSGDERVNGGATSATVSATRSAGAQSVDAPTHQMRFKIQNAIDEMQQELKDELQEDQLKIHGVLGQGAFGTVYHGVPCVCCLTMLGPSPPCLSASRFRPPRRVSPYYYPCNVTGPAATPAGSCGLFRAAPAIYR